MKIQDIMQFISSLRKSKKKVLTNYFLSCQNSKDDFQTWQGDESIVFCVQEEKLIRCYFASTDLMELNQLLGMVPAGTVMDYIAKEKIEEFSWTEGAGFKHYTTLVRYTNPNIYEEKPKTKKDLILEQFYDESIGEFATEEDAEELYELLYEVFDYRVSRLPSMQQLIEMIEKKWVLLYREKGRILSFLIYQIEGRKYYGYQIYNEGTADITYNLECKAIQYAKATWQIKSVYAWAEIGNKIANDRIGTDLFDGTYDYIFVKEAD